MIPNELALRATGALERALSPLAAQELRHNPLGLRSCGSCGMQSPRVTAEEQRQLQRRTIGGGREVQGKRRWSSMSWKPRLGELRPGPGLAVVRVDQTRRSGPGSVLLTSKWGGTCARGLVAHEDRAGAGSATHDVGGDVGGSKCKHTPSSTPKHL